MSKRHVGKICVYCGTAPAETMDHVFAREFLLVSRRVDLPKVSACIVCNGIKSGHEHYLTTVLPFASNHQDAMAVLSQMVERRLEKNAKLKRHLAAGHQQELTLQNGIFVPAMTLPFDGDRVGELFKFITQGLLYHHFKVILDRQKHGVWAGFLNRPGEEMHRKLLSQNARARVKGDIGGGAFVYEGAQGVDFPEMSIWVFHLFGGIRVSGDDHEPEAMTRLVGGVTASQRLLRLLEGGEGMDSPTAAQLP
ncbi:hypothetical protein [Bradyrhizobium sp. CCBAU 53380]|uniref:hypothetical protein n=1 Tax=Bradyrhizobium sp. CCBAU 53380 TaxID=1325117 RepID=UPI002303C14C|nr:hypothetical protein [Bradyrhizobium sp. CCBAU 53380]MDA9426239.1 hypothetical protein [Bradyrhizobium sp. CCBAU 53380]